MNVSATELKQNLSYYLTASQTEDVFVTKNGKVIAKISNPFQEKTAIVKSLRGCINVDMMEDEIKEERTSKL